MKKKRTASFNSVDSMDIRVYEEMEDLMKKENIAYNKDFLS